MEIPQWLESDEDYKLNDKKDGYITKNLRRFDKLVKLMQRERIYNYANGINASLKILSLILTIVLITLSKDIYQIWICMLFITLQIALNPGEIIIDILKKSVLTFIFPLIVFAPYALYAPAGTVINYYLKIFIIMLEVQIFVASTTVYSIGQALKQLHCPDVIIFIMDIVIKYLNFSTYLMCDILQAINMRSIGRDNKKYTTIGGIFTNVFNKVKRCSEELYTAMECRGFTDTYVKVPGKSINKKDILFIVCHVIFIVIYVYVRSLG
ncbi:energy-coupling factor transporter transmembrane component T [Terrisporobacter sp.]